MTTKVKAETLFRQLTELRDLSLRRAEEGGEIVEASVGCLGCLWERHRGKASAYDTAAAMVHRDFLAPSKAADLRGSVLNYLRVHGTTNMGTIARSIGVASSLLGWTLNDLLIAGRIVRVSRGVYALPDTSDGEREGAESTPGVSRAATPIGSKLKARLLDRLHDPASIKILALEFQRSEIWIGNTLSALQREGRVIRLHGETFATVRI